LLLQKTRPQFVTATKPEKRKQTTGQCTKTGPQASSLLNISAIVFARLTKTRPQPEMGQIMRFRIFPPAVASLIVATAFAFSPNLPHGVSIPPGATEALAAFDDQTNGFVAAQADHDADAMQFNEHESATQGLGPLYNADSCGSCHLNPVTGGISEVTELRAGHHDARGQFVEAPGGSLINSNILPGVPMPYVPERETIRTFRTSLNILGDGYVEAIADDTLVGIAHSQSDRTRGRIAGQVIQVPLLEAPGQTRVARFGWKNQHASLTSFSADAYLNEMGITTPVFPTERTSLGVNVTPFSKGAVPNNPGDDVDTFARFLRATKAPPRDLAAANTVEAQLGGHLFEAIGCETCHVSTIVTAPAGTMINGGTLTVPDALGNKIIHPFGDFLLHDVGTGDGIVQNGGQETANKLRTAPLWGVRTRNRLMHDGNSLTFEQAIDRHRGEAEETADQFRRLTTRQKNALIAFLHSL
jgi:hypothetical protein